MTYEVMFEDRVKAGLQRSFALRVYMYNVVTEAREEINTSDRHENTVKSCT